MKDQFNWKKQIKTINELFPTFKILNTKELNNYHIKDEKLIELMKSMVWARTLNNQSTSLAKQGRLGFYAPTIGQEASQMASYLAFEKEDFLYPSYRDVPQLVKHGLPLEKAFLWSRGHSFGNIYEETLRAMPPQIIIGAQTIQAVGTALGMQKRNKKQVTFTYIGDGGTSQGDFYEGINFAGSFKLPIVFFIQNNGHAISTPRKIQTNAHTLAQKGVAAGIPSIAVDGMDALAVYVVSEQARNWALEKNGPVVIEIISTRVGPHSMSGDDPTRYREKIELENTDPLIPFREFLISKNIWDLDLEEKYILEVTEEISTAVTKADKIAKQKISDFLKNMYEHPSYIINEQIEYYLKKEGEQNG